MVAPDVATGSSIRVRVMKRSRKTMSQVRASGPMVLDVTSKSADPVGVKFSPFYPIGDLAVPGLPDVPSASVEGAWQGLKVFSCEDPDLSKLAVRTMRNLKRGLTHKRGRILGHVLGNKTIGYIEARESIYLPLYDQVLERLSKEVDEIRRVALADHGGEVVLLDYETNGDVKDARSPLSHASLLAKALMRAP
jgi:hypothetical protein